VSLYGDKRFSHKDAFHDEAVACYEELFCSVVDLHTLGHGIPDLLVGAAGCDELVEVKSEQGQLETNQVTFNKTWRGHKVTVVRTRADIINHVANIRERVSRIGRRAG
jgi:hypothetical protein